MQLDLVRFLARQKLNSWRAGPRMELGMRGMLGSSRSQGKKGRKGGRGESPLHPQPPFQRSYEAAPAERRCGSEPNWFLTDHSPDFSLRWFSADNAAFALFSCGYQWGFFVLFLYVSLSCVSFFSTIFQACFFFFKLSSFWCSLWTYRWHKVVPEKWSSQQKSYNKLVTFCRQPCSSVFLCIHSPVRPVHHIMDVSYHC